MEGLTPLIIPGNIPAADVCRQIDVAVSGLRRQIAALLSQRNSLKPICRLPPEILSEIFLLAKGRTFSGDFYVLETFGWLRFTHVCRYWRNIALASPDLWARGPWPLDDTEFLKEMLSRSKEGRLVVKADTTTSDDNLQGLKLILKQTQRIKHLAIRIDPKEWVELQKMLPIYAPELEHLSLACTSAYAPPFVLEGCFSQTTKLRHLALNGFDIDWDFLAPLGRNLIYLKIHGIPTYAPTWEEFSDAMKEMPNLEVLDLHDAFPSDTDEHVSSTLDFPSLQLLIMGKHTPREVEKFLSHITLPPTVKIRVTKCYQHSFSDLRNDLSSFLERLVKSISSVTLQNVSYFQTLIFLHQWTGIGLRLFTEALDDNQVLETDMDPRLELDISWRTGNAALDIADIATVTTAIFDSGIGPLLQNVTRIYLAHLMKECKPDMLAKTFGRLRKVRHITSTNTSSRVLVDVLQQRDVNGDCAAGSSGLDKSLYFPDLSSLCLVGIERMPTHQAAGHALPGSFPVQSLYDCLMWRCNTGAKIENLIFKVCSGISQDDMKLFQGIVDDVEWNNEEIEINSDCNYSDYVELMSPV